MVEQINGQGKAPPNPQPNAPSDYIRVKTAYNKLKTARTIEQNVYLYGVTGCGKTELVTHFLGRERYTINDCKNGYLKVMQETEKGKRQDKRIIIIDNLQFLRDEEDRRQVLSMTQQEDIWLILIARCPLSPWLLPSHIQNPFVLIGEKDLVWQEAEIQKYFTCLGVEVTNQQIQEIYSISSGNPMAIRLAANISRQENGYSEDVVHRAWHDMEHYLEQAVISEWNPTVVNFLMHMSFVESFTIPLAEQITGNRDSYRLVQEAALLGNFLSESDTETYILRPVLRSGLLKRARRLWGSEKCREIYYNAAHFYEMQDNVLTALELYEKSGNKNRIRELLIRNAGKNPGNGHYFQLRKYYLSLSEEEIAGDAILMSGMSMLYSLLLKPEESEYWYDKLKEYEKGQIGGIKREAQSRIAYLDIALPHRGVTGILELIKSIPTLLLDKGITLPEFSVTSNLPSVMNGGKDFSEWSKKDRQIAGTMGKVVATVLGRYGKGLVNIALAESQYEKGGDTYEILSLLGKGSLEAEAGGKLEMEFASIGVQVRLNLFHGNDEAATNILDSFEKKVEENHAVEIRKSIAALRCRIALYNSDTKAVKQWIGESPEENKEFFIMERYRYLTKVRCYLFLGETMAALVLLEKLSMYAEQYHRPLIQIETKMLMAITYYRMKNENWQELLLETIHLARDYGFYRIISEEGAALLELWKDKNFQKLLLQEQEPKEKNKSAQMKQQDYLQKLGEEIEEMAVCFPGYLLAGVNTPPEFSENALTILKLQAEGHSNTEIAKMTGITYANVKYHSGETYKKLGVNGRVDAVLAARELKIL